MRRGAQKPDLVAMAAAYEQAMALGLDWQIVGIDHNWAALQVGLDQLTKTGDEVELHPVSFYDQDFTVYGNVLIDDAHGIAYHFAWEPGGTVRSVPAQVWIEINHTDSNDVVIRRAITAPHCREGFRATVSVHDRTLPLGDLLVEAPERPTLVKTQESAITVRVYNEHEEERPYRVTLVGQKLVRDRDSRVSMIDVRPQLPTDLTDFRLWLLSRIPRGWYGDEEAVELARRIMTPGTRERELFEMGMAHAYFESNQERNEQDEEQPG